MTWNDTHRYYDALLTVVAELERGDGLRWRPGYAEIFGDRDGLLLALRRRWNLMVHAQVEQPHDLRALAARNRGMLEVLENRVATMGAA